MIRRFRHAFRGLHDALRTDSSTQFHVVIASCVLLFGAFSCLTLHEWVLLFLMIGLVIAAEIGNSALERLADHVHPEQHPAIRRVKDLASASVLVAALTSVIIGIIIFSPVLLNGNFGTCFAQYSSREVILGFASARGMV